MLQRKTPLKRGSIKRKSKTRREKRRPTDVQDYWEWLLTQPCSVTGSEREHHPIDRSHVSRLEYGNGMGTKSADWFSFSLHHTLHMELEQNKIKWEQRYGPQEYWLLLSWQRYGMDKIPLEVQAKFINPDTV